MILHSSESAVMNRAEKRFCQDFLRQDLSLIFPTDTVMGIGVNGNSQTAVERLYEKKGRIKDKPLILLVADSVDAIPYVQEPSLLEHPLLKKNWPGPLTGVFAVHSECSLCFFIGDRPQTIGIRVPNEPYLRDFLRVLSFPLVTTSANPSDLPPFSNAEEAQHVFGEDSLILHRDSKKSSKEPSSVLLFSRDGYQILRKGVLSGK